MTPVDVLIGPFAAPFLLRPLLVLLVLAVAAGIIGTVVHVRRLEFTTDTVTHAVFPGLAIGIAVGGDDALLPGALIAATLAAIALVLFSGRGAPEDATLAVILTTCFSLGVIVVSRSRDWTGGVGELLFGRLLTVSADQVISSAVLIAVVVAVVLVWWRPILARAFDLRAARTGGLPVRSLDLLVAIAVAWVVVVAVWAIGTLLAIAVLVIPAAVGRLVRARIGTMILVAVLFGALASWAGLLIANWVSVAGVANLPPGATVAATLVLGYLLVLCVTRIPRAVRRA